MSKEKTSLTEIAFVKGASNTILTEEVLNCGISPEQNKLFSESLKDSKLLSIALIFWELGQRISQHYKDKNPITTSLWTGEKKSNLISKVAAQDVLLNENIVVSLKENSNIITNGSPQRFLEFLPQGIVTKDKKHSNWYERIDKDFLSYLFSTCYQEIRQEIMTYDDFMKQPKEIRKKFTKEFNCKAKQNPKIKEIYQLFCESISQKSAELFNSRLKDASKEIKETIFKEMFRIEDDLSYNIAGLEKGISFISIVPSWKEWVEKFEIVDIYASTKKGRGQPEVFLNFKFKNIETNEVFETSVGIEIRWSHGKFSGAPEAKIYKLFKYSDLPWLVSINCQN